MTAPKPEAPGLEELDAVYKELESEIESYGQCYDRVSLNLYQAQIVLASLECLRAIENAKEMPEEPVEIIKAVTEQSCANGCGSMKHCICSYAEDLVDDNRKVRLHAQHLQDRLNRIEALMREPAWVVNDLGELGVEIGNRIFFLYKGGNIEYDGFHDDGTPLLYRPVGKREFGEVCYPAKWQKEGRSQRRYTEELVFTPGLSYGKPADGRWRPLPPKAMSAALLAKVEGRE